MNKIKEMSGKKIVTVIAIVNIAFILIGWLLIWKISVQIGAQINWLTNWQTTLIEVLSLLFAILLFTKKPSCKFGFIILTTLRAFHSASSFLFFFPIIALIENLCLIASVFGLLFHKNAMEYFASSENLTLYPEASNSSKPLETSSGAENTDIEKHNYRTIWKYSGAPWTIAILFLNYAVVLGYSIFMLLEQKVFYISFTISFLIPFIFSIGLICGKSWSNKLLLAILPANIIANFIAIINYFLYPLDPELVVYYRHLLPLNIFSLIIAILVLVILLLKKTDIAFYTTNSPQYISQREINIGKTIVISISISILISLFLTIFYDFSILRCVLHIGMLILLIRGYSWARYFFVISSTLAIIRSFVFLIDFMSVVPNSASVMFSLFLTDITIYGLIIIAMLKSKCLKEYMYQKRYS